jgi:hypothetical protein
VVIRRELTAQKNLRELLAAAVPYYAEMQLLWADFSIFLSFLVHVVVRIYSNFIIGIKDYYLLKQPQRLSTEPQNQHDKAMLQYSCYL